MKRHAQTFSTRVDRSSKQGRDRGYWGAVETLEEDEQSGEYQRCPDASLPSQNPNPTLNTTGLAEKVRAALPSTSRTGRSEKLHHGPFDSFFI